MVGNYPVSEDCTRKWDGSGAFPSPVAALAATRCDTDVATELREGPAPFAHAPFAHAPFIPNAAIDSENRGAKGAAQAAVVAHAALRVIYQSRSAHFFRVERCGNLRFA